MMRLPNHSVEQHRARAIEMFLQPHNLEVRVYRFVGLDQVALCAQPSNRGPKIAKVIAAHAFSQFCPARRVHCWRSASRKILPRSDRGKFSTIKTRFGSLKAGSL